MTPRQLRLSRIETAKMRHAWAKDQCDKGEPTPALIQYLEASFNELAALMTTNPRIDEDSGTLPEDLKRSG